MTLMHDIDWLTMPFSPISLQALNEKAEMMSRIDNKYVVSGAALASLVPAFAEIFDVLEISQQRSFTYATRYFDTPRNEAYHQHHQGVRQRMKVRMRRYVDAGLCFLEVKVKGKRDMTEKFRMSYDPVNPEVLSDEAHDFARTTYARQYDKPFVGALTPTLDMRYRRITLVARAGGERMTIDTDLHFSAGGRTVSTGSEVFILETKSENGRGIADQVLRAGRQRPTRRCSKYCIGLAVTGQVARYNHFLAAVRRLGLTIPSAHPDGLPELRQDPGRAIIRPGPVASAAT